MAKPPIVQRLVPNFELDLEQHIISVHVLCLDGLSNELKRILDIVVDVAAPLVIAYLTQFAMS